MKKRKRSIYKDARDEVLIIVDPEVLDADEGIVEMPENAELVPKAKFKKIPKTQVIVK
jgi:hypothetical protein